MIPPCGQDRTGKELGSNGLRVSKAWVKLKRLPRLWSTAALFMHRRVHGTSASPCCRLDLSSSYMTTLDYPVDFVTLPAHQAQATIAALLVPAASLAVMS